jgi:heat-inducible transcriptional repressor
LVLVLFGGEVKQQMLTLADPLPQSRLSAVTDRLNSLFEGFTQADVAARLSQLDDRLEEEVARLTLDIIRRADGRTISDFHRDGLANIVDDEGARQAVRVLEERSLLSSVLTETLTPEVSGVQVVIGGEGRWEELKDCAIIVSRYGLEQQLAGVVAVVGPTRMPYGRNISAVRYVASLMSGFVYDYYMDSPQLAEPEG